MTIDFGSLNYDLQVIIAKKMNLFDHIEFQQSSRVGNSVGIGTRKYTILDVEMIYCHKGEIFLWFEHPYQNEQLKTIWNSIRKYSDLPRFNIEFIEKSKNASFAAISKFLDEARFANESTKLCWRRQEANEVEMFVKLVERLNVTTFDTNCQEDDSAIVYLPQFLRMQSISFPLTQVPNELFHAVEAHSISHVHLAPQPSVSTTINQFFQQWVCKQREIRFVSICTEESKVEDMIRDLPVQLMCTNINTELNIRKRLEVYLMDRGDKKLEVTIRWNALSANEIGNMHCFNTYVEWQISMCGSDRCINGVPPPRIMTKKIRKKKSVPPSK